MRRSWTGVYWGTALIIIGVFFMLFSMGALEPYTDIFVLGTVGVLLLAGLAFLGGALVRQGSWWLVLPGFLLLGIAALVYLSLLAPSNGSLQAAVLFFMLGLGYLALFVTNRQDRWWAWWVGGTFLLLALLLWMGLSFRSAVIGPALLGGLGIVVGLGAFLMPRTMPRWWAMVLAVVALTAAGLILSASVTVRNGWVRFWPLGMLALGLGILIWTFARWSARGPERPLVSSLTPPVNMPTGSVIPVEDDKEVVSEPSGGETPAAPRPVTPVPSEHPSIPQGAEGPAEEVTAAEERSVEERFSTSATPPRKLRE